jgi:transposase-like protein
MRKYDDEFKREAVKKDHDGQSVASVARELGVAESLLHNWKRQVTERSSDADKETLILKKRIRELEMERDMPRRRQPLSSAEVHSALPLY